MSWLAVIAQLVERLLPKQKVAGSNPVRRSNLLVYPDACVAQLVEQWYRKP